MATQRTSRGLRTVVLPQPLALPASAQDLAPAGGGSVTASGLSVGDTVSFSASQVSDFSLTQSRSTLTACSSATSTASSWRLDSGRAVLKLEPLLSGRNCDEFLGPVDGPPRSARQPSRPNTTPGRSLNLGALQRFVPVSNASSATSFGLDSQAEDARTVDSGELSAAASEWRNAVALSKRPPSGGHSWRPGYAARKRLRDRLPPKPSTAGSRTSSASSFGKGISSTSRFGKGVKAQRPWTIGNEHSRSSFAETELGCDDVEADAYGHGSARREEARKSVLEIVYVRQSIPEKMFRGILEKEVMDEQEEQQAQISCFRLENKKEYEEEERKQAAMWREKEVRIQKIHETQWMLQDQTLQSYFESRGRLLPTPAEEDTGTRDEDEGDGDDQEKDKGPGLKPKKPLELRLRTIRRQTKKMYRIRREEKAKERARAIEGLAPAIPESVAEDDADGESDGELEDEAENRKKEGVIASFSQSVFCTPSMKNVLKAGFRQSIAGQSVEAAVAKLPSLPSKIEEAEIENVDDKVVEAKDMTQLAQDGVGQVNSLWKRASAVAISQVRMRTPLKAKSKFEQKEEMTMLAILAKYDEDNDETLGQGEMLDCLQEVGLRCRTEKERQTVHKIIWDIDELYVSFEFFKQNVITNISSSLAELRLSKYQVLFRELDLSGNGFVSIEEICEKLRRSALHVSNEVLRDSLLAYSRARGRGETLPAGFKKTVLNLENFVLFVNILCERYERDYMMQWHRLSQRFGLPAQEKESWKHDLVSMHSMFHDYDPCSGKYGSASGALREAQAIKVIRESGYMPKLRPKQTALTATVHEKLGPDGTLGFKEFLQIMHQLRELDRERLRRAFDIRCGVANGTLPQHEATTLLEDCGCVPRTADEKAELEAILVDIDDEGAEVLSSEDFVSLCQRMTAQMRVFQHERERQFILGAGWSEKGFAEFHHAFNVFDEDMSEVLERDELMKAVELLKGQYWQSSGNMNMMLMALGIDPHRDINVNFLTFLRMLKMLDESETRRQQGEAVGYKRDITDLLFTSYQALEPLSEGLTKATFQNALMVGCRNYKGAQLQESLNQLQSEPAQVEFTSFLRVIKVLEALIENDFDEFIADVQGWEDIVAVEGEEILHPDLEKRKREVSKKKEQKGLNSSLTTEFANFFGSSKTPATPASGDFNSQANFAGSCESHS